MAYFRNSAVNLLNVHYGIHSIAMSSGGAFILLRRYYGAQAPIKTTPPGLAAHSELQVGAGRDWR